MGKPLTHKPSTNTAAVITIAASSGVAHEIEQLTWSYGGTPTAGNLKIESPSGTTIFEVDVTSAGPGFIPFSGSTIKGTSGAAVIITLAAAGSGVQGTVNAVQRTN